MLPVIVGGIVARLGEVHSSKLGHDLHLRRLPSDAAVPASLGTLGIVGDPTNKRNRYLNYVGIPVDMIELGIALPQSFLLSLEE
mgnify:CR=1 FL=1